MRITELSQTIEMMTSSDYKERFKAEYYQVKIRVEKLRNMMEKWDKNELDFTPTCPASTYNWQLKVMEDYLQILKARANMEGVDL